MNVANPIVEYHAVILPSEGAAAFGIRAVLIGNEDRIALGNVQPLAAATDGVPVDEVARIHGAAL